MDLRKQGKRHYRREDLRSNAITIFTSTVTPTMLANGLPILWVDPSKEVPHLQAAVECSVGNLYRAARLHSSEMCLRLARLRLASHKSNGSVSLATLPAETFDIIIDHLRRDCSPFPRYERPFKEKCFCLTPEKARSMPTMQMAFERWAKAQASDDVNLQSLLAGSTKAGGLNLGNTSAAGALSLFEASTAWQSAFAFTSLVEFKTCTGCREAYASAWKELAEGTGSKDPTIALGQKQISQFLLQNGLARMPREKKYDSKFHAWGPRSAVCLTSKDDLPPWGRDWSFQAMNVYSRLVPSPMPPWTHKLNQRSQTWQLYLTCWTWWERTGGTGKATRERTVSLHEHPTDLPLPWREEPNLYTSRFVLPSGNGFRGGLPDANWRIDRGRSYSMSVTV